MSNSSEKLNPDPEKVFSVFKEHYQKVPLEVFKKNPYKSLISTLLSSRTKDEVTLEASKRLFEKAPNLERLGRLEVNAIEKLIYPVGFYKTKANYLRELAQILIKKHGGEIPRSRTVLLRLPGVGRKTANLVLNRAFGKPAIAVDTHVHRITNLLGWVDTEKPEETERELNKKLPKKYWSDINRYFVSIGRQHTTKKGLKKFLKDNNLI